MIGSIKEYEMMVSVDGIQIPQSQLEDYHKRNKEAEENRRAMESERLRTNPEPKENCPFKRGKNNLSVNCERNCAFYGESSCIFAATSSQPTRDTQGMNCPIAGTCITSCAMYAGGCKFIELLMGTNRPGRKKHG